jgi:DnaJ-domain-containing protein 1
LRAKPQTIEALTRMGAVAPHTIERMVYVLTLTRHLDFGLGHTPMGIGLVSERDESLLEPKESLRPSRPVVLAAGTPPAETLQIGLDDSVRLDRNQIATAHTPIATAIDSLRVTPLPLEAKGVSHTNLPPTQTGPSEKVVVSAAVKPAASPARAASTESPAMVERRQQIEKLDRALATSTYFDVLGVARDATPSQIQDAYLKAAKSYHPDRLPPELSDLKPQTSRIFARMSEAHQTLSDPTKRTQYVDQINRGVSSDEDEKVRRVLRAAGSFQKAEVLLKKRMMAAAELEANRALEDDPEQADYLALCAWIQVCKPDSEARLPELCKMLTEAIHRNPNSEKNRFYRVQVYKRLGQIDRAVADCRLIVDRNPHHVDAQREIRLWEMRRAPNKQTPARGTIPPRTSSKSTSDRPAAGPSAGRKSDPPPHSPGGLLGRLFKRL